jgi:hypothetical protein
MMPFYLQLITVRIQKRWGTQGVRWICFVSVTKVAERGRCGAATSIYNLIGVWPCLRTTFRWSS